MPNWTTNALRCSKRDSEKFLQNGVVDFNKFRPMPESMNVEYSVLPNGEKLLVSGSHNDAEVDMLYYLSERGTRIIDMEQVDIIGKFILKGTTLPLEEKACFDILDEKVEEAFEKMEKKYDSASKEEQDEAYERGSKWYVNLKDYGVYDWYDWSCRFWGTKWNACDVQVSDADNGQVLISFDTAWCSPDSEMLRSVFDTFEDDYVYEAADEDFNGVYDEDGNSVEDPVLFEVICEEYDDDGSTYEYASLR